jgi:hypothetical protein
MSVFNFYIDRAENYTVVGKSNELIFVTRKGRRESATAMNNDKLGLLSDNTAIVVGDIVTTAGINYFVVSKQSSTESTSCQLRKANCVVSIVRIVKHYTNGTFDYNIESPLFSDVPSAFWDITGKMQQYDLGLSATTTKKFLISKLDVKLLDRIKVGVELFTVDVIGTSEYEGLLSIQCSPDKRPTHL